MSQPPNGQGDRPGQPEQAQPAEMRPRTAAEWVSLAISLAIVLGVVALTVYAYREAGDEPARIAVQPLLAEMRQVNGAYYLPIEVINEGGGTAQDVWVEVTLGTGDTAESSQFTVPFLAGGETSETMAVFRQDPAAGELQTAISFLEP